MLEHQNVEHQNDVAQTNTAEASTAEVTQEQEDWFDRGKEDAWSGQAKQPPEDPQAASLYDLGYSEGNTQRPPAVS